MTLSRAILINVCLVVCAAPLRAHGGDEALTSGQMIAHTLNLLGLSLVMGALLLHLYEPKHERSVWTWVGWGLMGASALLVLQEQAVLNGETASQLLLTSETQVVGGFAFSVVWGLRLVLWLLLGLGLLWPRPAALLLGLTLITASITEIYRHPFSLEDTLVLLTVDVALQISGATFFGLALLTLVAVSQRRRPLRRAALADILGVAALIALAAGVLQQPEASRVPVLLGAAVILLASFLGRRVLAAPHAVLTIGQIAVASLVLLALNPFTTSRPLTPPEQLDYQAQVTGGISASLEVSPALPGRNTFYLTLIDGQTGVRLTDASDVELTSSGGVSLRLMPMGDGVYSAAAIVENSGSQQAVVRVVRPNVPDLTLTFDYVIATSAP